MALTYQLEHPVLTFVTVGHMDFDGGRPMLTALAAARAQPLGGWHLLFDLRQSTENRSTPELRSLADLLEANRDLLSGRIALVAQATLMFGLSRMFTAFADQRGMVAEVFGTPEEARAWLCLHAGAATRPTMR